MKKSFLKVIIRDFIKNISRFVAIIAIVALGVGFLIGLLSATPDLRYSLDNYFDEQNMYDINIKSTVGFSKDDINKLTEDEKSIVEIEGVSCVDYDCTYKGLDKTIRLITKNFSSKINKLDLISGRLPKSKNECVVLNKGILFDVDCIGQNIVVDSEQYEIVGVVNSSIYYYKILETTTIGNGNLDIIAYVDEQYVDELIITDIYLTVSNIDKESRFDDDYFESLKVIEKNLEEISQDYLLSRKEKLKEDAIEVGIKEAKQSEEYLSNLEMIRETIITKFPAGTPEDTINNAIIQYTNLLNKNVEDKVIKTVEEEFKNLELKWYILNLKSNISYASFKGNSAKVDSIAVVFPIFFYFIAALIALTSVTRIITEDRSSIGTLKSLGYSNGKIICKYLFYAIVSCLTGTLLGLTIGVYILPMVIYNCFNMLFVMPTGCFPFLPNVILFSTMSISITIFGVMVILCLITLSEKPNSLLVPKAPKSGKKILLERISFFWKNLKFKYKSSIRNIFRFKKNLIMMIIGVGGCTALMLVAFGLNDAISLFSKGQYENVLKYDVNLTIDDKIEFPMLKDSEILYLYKEKGKALENEEFEMDIYYSNEQLNNYLEIDVKEFKNDTVIVSKQLAKEFNLVENSTFEVLIGDKKKIFTITDIFDNYISNYIIVNQSQIEEEQVNTCLIKFGKNDRENKESIILELYDLEKISMIEDLSQTRITYDAMSESIGIVVYLVVFMCGALAVIVIYNLTNININERIKEIATLRVLGYQKKEVRWYIYREILIMSILGIILGLFMGPVLNDFVMRRISSPGQYFTSNILWPNYLYTATTTLIFIFLVFILFINRFEKIKMVESLKSVD